MGMKADVANCTAFAAFLSYEVQEETVLPEGSQRFVQLRNIYESAASDSASCAFLEGFINIPAAVLTFRVTGCSMQLRTTSCNTGGRVNV